MINKNDIIPQKGSKLTIRNLLHGIGSFFFYPIWVIQKFHKRDPFLWTFGAWSGERYDDNSRALFEYVIKNCPEIKAVWMTRDKKIYDTLKASKIPVAMCNTREGNRIQRNAGVFFATANRFDGDTRYMNGILYVNLWHGVPIKKIGEDIMVRIREQSTFKTMKTWYRKTFIPWEFIQGVVVCGSPFFAPFIQSAFGLSANQIWITPEPRLDWLARTGKTSFMSNLDKRFDHPIKILYMPTFRDDKLMTFNPFTQIPFNINQFAKILEENNIVLIYKGHYFDNNCKGVNGCDRILTVGDESYDNLYSFIKDADILLTDYSSVYFDFLYLKKPIILFPFDYDDYMIHSRDFYFDYNLMKGVKVYTWDELATCLKNKQYIIPSDEEIAYFRPLPIGNCAQQIVQLTKNTIC